MKYKDVEKLFLSTYLPVLEINRHIRLPLNSPRKENDAEHSFSLAFLGAALAEKIGLDPGKVALYAIYHDFLEVYAGDTSVWDRKSNETKIEREKKAVKKINKLFKNLPVIPQSIEDYETLKNREARFVFALDKLVPFILHLQDSGKFFRENKITYEHHMERVKEIRLKVSQDPFCLRWYDESLSFASKNRKKLFYHKF